MKKMLETKNIIIQLMKVNGTYYIEIEEVINFYKFLIQSLVSMNKLDEYEFTKNINVYNIINIVEYNNDQFKIYTANGKNGGIELIDKNLYINNQEILKDCIEKYEVDEIINEIINEYFHETQEKKYLDNFYQPDFSTYDFVFLFSAIYASQKKYCFDRNNLIEFINYSKKTNKYKKILDDINLKSNGIYYFSEEFEEAISKLKWANILYTVSPEQDSSIYIFKDIPVEEIINSKITYLDETTHFINDYKIYETCKNNPRVELTTNETLFADVVNPEYVAFAEDCFVKNYCIANEQIKVKRKKIRKSEINKLL